MELTELQNMSEAELKAAFDAQAAKSAELQKMENANDPVKADYIILAKNNTKALSSFNKDLYIEGLTMGDFFVQDKKLVLGKELEVVPLSFITLYNEMEEKKENARFFGVWNEEQARQFPVDGNNWWQLRMPNGHVLRPVNWVLVEVLGHPELKKAVVSYKSTGNRIWRQWKEDVKKRCGSDEKLSAPSFVYKLKAEQFTKDNNAWLDIVAEYEGLIYEKNLAMAVFCTQKSIELREAYEKGELIPDRKVEAPVQYAAIEDNDSAASSMATASLDDAAPKAASFDEMKPAKLAF